MDILIIFEDGRTVTMDVRSLQMGDSPDHIVVDGSVDLYGVRHFFANYIDRGAETQRNPTFAHDCPTCRAKRAVVRNYGPAPILKDGKPIEAALRDLADRADNAELADGSSLDTLQAHAVLGDLVQPQADGDGGVL